MTWDIDRLGKAASDAVRPAPTPGATLGKYRVIREIAGGAAGVVYEAEDPGLRRRVALKVLREIHGTSEVLRRRFEREAQAAAGLDHPNVLRVFDAGEDGGRMYLAMELVNGESLADRLAQRPFERRPMLRLLVKAARGVAAAHARGIVHRDVKPANILVTRENEPKVGDFGLARVMDAETTLTRSGTPMGTPLYMAPEQARGDHDAISPATDVYALGAILYEILTGRAPHTGQSATEIYGKILSSDPLPPRRQDSTIPSELETICLMALESEPSRRYATASEFADDLDRHLNGESILARPPGAVVRGIKWAKRHQAATVGAVLSAVFIAAIIGILLQQVGRARRETAALKLVETARPGIDQVVRGLYRAHADLVALRRPLAAGRASLDEAAALDPVHALPHYLLGRSWDLEGDEVRAEAEWRRAVDLEPTFGPAWFQLGRLHAFQAFTTSVGYSDEDRRRRQETSKRLGAEAMQMLERALKSGSGFDDAMQAEFAAALQQQVARRNDEARQACVQAILKYGDVEGIEEFHWLLGWASSGSEQMQAYDRALAICPLHWRSLYCRAMAHGEARRPLEAVADYTRVLAIQPALAGARVNRADQKIDLGDLDGAIADCDEALRRDGSFVPALITRAIARRQKKDLDGAIADYDAALRADPHLVTAWINRAHAWNEKGDVGKARADFDRAVDADLTLATTRISRGQFRWLQNQKAEALEDLSRAIELDSSNPDGWYFRGAGEAELGKRDEAIRDLLKLLEIAPKNYPFRPQALKVLELLNPKREH